MTTIVTDAVDIAALERWMDGAGLGDGPITDIVGLAGGTQNILARFRRSDRDYVFRRPPMHPRPESNETMRREARVLTALAGSAVPHAALIAAEGDEAKLGFAFYLMEPIEGFNPLGGMPALHAGSGEARHRMGLAMVQALAQLHALDPDAVGLTGFGKPDGYLERQVQRWRSQLDGYAAITEWPGAGELGDIAAVGRWLESHRARGSASGILHGDFHLGNVMFRLDSPEVAAIVDWELATIGDPLVDLGWLLATWHEPGDEWPIVAVDPPGGFATGAQLVAGYAARSARDLSAIGWYGVFGCYKMAILLEGTYARSRAGKAAADLGERMHARARRLIARAQRWIAHGAPFQLDKQVAA